MKNQKILNEAGQMINSAKDELSRSEDNLTTFNVCHNSREALVKSMSYFLSQDGTNPKGPLTVENLLNQCKAKDARFKNIDLSNILCRHEEGSQEFCLSYDKVSKCLNSADLVHKIVADSVS